MDTIDARRVIVVRDTVQRVLGAYQSAYFALHTLPDRVEDLRVLSLNAELAAARAGSRGAAIKVATQNTRELVTQLTQVTQRMGDARLRCYRSGALALRGLPRIARFSRTADLIRSAGGRHQAGALAALDRAARDRAVAAAGEMSGLIEGGAELRKFAATLNGLMMQAVAIANTLAIEATGVIGHEATFALVAAQMQKQIGELKAIIAEAAAHVARGNEIAQGIAACVNTLGRQVAA